MKKQKPVKLFTLDTETYNGLFGGLKRIAIYDGNKVIYGYTFEDIEKDALGEIGNISMGSAATTLSVLLGHKVNITTPTVHVDTISVIKNQYPMPYLVVEVGYVIGINGNNILAIQVQNILSVPLKLLVQSDAYMLIYLPYWDQ